jgi:hypothetical protein
MEDEDLDFLEGLITWVGHIIAPALVGFWLLDGYDVNDISTGANMMFGYGLLGYAGFRLVQVLTNLWVYKMQVAAHEEGVSQRAAANEAAEARRKITPESSERDLSNAADKKSVTEELRGAKALLDDGIIDDDEFKQMKKDILGN